MKSSAVSIQTKSGEIINVQMECSDDREVGTVFIDGVPYHIERMKKRLMRNTYRIDGDADYIPKSDTFDRCVLIAPYSQQ